MKEEGGGDNLAVRWQLPGGAIEEPIPSSRLTVFGLGPPQITQPPANTTVLEGGDSHFHDYAGSQCGRQFPVATRYGEHPRRH